MDNRKKAVLKTAIITMSFVQLGTNGIAPILAQIQEAFPAASAANVQFLMTFPSIFSLIFSMVCAFLSNRLPKRTLAMSGLILVVAAGILGCLFHGSLIILFVWAALLGIGIGMTAPLAAGSLGIALSYNHAVIFVCCLVAGSSISLVMPACMGAAGRLKGYETLNSSLILGTSFVGVFVTPVLTTLTATITGSESVTYRFLMVCVVAILLAVLTVVLKKRAVLRNHDVYSRADVQPDHLT